jgi:hypothetical protein
MTNEDQPYSSQPGVRFAAEYTALSLMVKAMVLTHPFPEQLRMCLEALYEAGVSGATAELLPALDEAVLNWRNGIPRLVPKSKD